MRRRHGPIIAIILLVSLVSTTVYAQSGPRVVAYVPNWIDLTAFAGAIDYAKLTHINIAFENPTSDNGELSFNKKNDALIAKARANNVAILVSIAGGAAATDKPLTRRYFDLIGDAQRAKFVGMLADYVVKHNFDGLDVDLEGPAINKDYGPFIHELAAALKAKKKLLTAALSQGYGGKQVPDSVFADLDFVNIMAYDAAGSWDPKSPGQHSSLEFAKTSVAYWLERGLPRSKAVLGVPFYGYGFGEAFRKRSYSYAAIVAAHAGAENADQTGNTIWYNGIPTIKAKSQLVLDERLGGIMIWSLDCDAPGDRSLLAAVHQIFSAASNAKPNR